MQSANQEQTAWCKSAKNKPTHILPWHRQQKASWKNTCLKRKNASHFSSTVTPQEQSPVLRFDSLRTEARLTSLRKLTTPLRFWKRKRSQGPGSARAVRGRVRLWGLPLSACSPRMGAGVGPEDVNGIAPAVSSLLCPYNTHSITKGVEGWTPCPSAPTSALSTSTPVLLPPGRCWQNRSVDGRQTGKEGIHSTPHLMAREALFMLIPPTPYPPPPTNSSTTVHIKKQQVETC